MDIGFHYFAVKTLAVKAGFLEEEAQNIAQFSQYIDDYDIIASHNLANIPAFVRVAQYDMASGDSFAPVTTGFFDNVDMASLIRTKSQYFTVSPFHFVPRDVAQTARNDYRATPARKGDDSFASNQLAVAKNRYMAANTVEQRRLATMHLGMSLHTFADTYAHQLFTGFNESVNKVTLLNVVNNITNRNETEKYRAGIVTYLDWLHRIVSGVSLNIGHMMLGHIPDLTHLSFVMRYVTPDGAVCTYTRSNTSEFVAASKEILNFLRGCLGETNVPEYEWEAFKPQLAQAFLFDMFEYTTEAKMWAGICRLAEHWKSVFPANIYEYNRNSIFDGIVKKYDDFPNTAASAESEMVTFPTTMSEDFYRFNCYAEDFLISLYRMKPRTSIPEQPGDGLFTCRRSGENSFAASVSGGMKPNGPGARINDEFDLSDIIKFNNGGKVFAIKLEKTTTNLLYSYVVKVDAQGPQGLMSGSGYLYFTDQSGDRYSLSIFSSTRKEHTVNFNSPRANIVKIEWSNTTLVGDVGDATAEPPQIT